MSEHFNTMEDGEGTLGGTVGFHPDASTIRGRHNPYSNSELTDPIYQELLKSEGFYRDWLKRHFKPEFDNYEQENGMPMIRLKQFLEQNNYRLPSHKMDKFLKQMDKNADGRITFDEFYECVIRKRKEDLPKAKRIGITTILAASPSLAIDERKQAKKYTRQERIDTQDGPSVVIVNEKLEDEIPDSYLEAYNCKPPPIIMPLFILSEIAVFIYYALEIQKKNESNNQLSWTTGIPYWSPCIYRPTLRQEAWRFVTYMFIHQGYHHIMFNIIIEILLGIPLEIVHKFWRMGPIFLTGVISGSLACSVFDPSMGLVGASGGCYALIGAHIALVIMNWEELQHEWLDCKKNPLAFISSGVVRLIVLALLLGIDFGVALYQRYGLKVTNQTSFVAHCGGLGAGILIGIPVLRNLDEKHWEKVLFWVSLAVFTCLVIFAILWNIFYPDFPKSN